ncbi:family 16 glycoside hydrolase [Oleiharenicola lentus]|uniref:family 16 glycoside hydrolase n=1 Tax=Oleiharenicola lentus TaxID=2508720 RepID=UPI003F6754F5
MITFRFTSFLLSAAAALFAAGCQSTSAGSSATASAPAKPAIPAPAHHIELGMQAWTLNRGTFAEAVEKTAKLGVRYMQAYPRQKIGGGIDGTMVPTMDAATRAKVLALLKSNGVTLTSFGVVRAANEEEWRQIFAFAKDMGLRDIAVEPAKNTWGEVFPILDKLSQEYGVAVTIHNHPNPNNPPADVVAALKPYGKHLGICGDTGHWARSGFDPIECLRAAESRLISLHFKDLTQIAKPANDVPWGTGASNAAGQIAELRRQNFKGIAYIEYEHRTPQLEAEVARSVEFFRRAEKASDADLIAGRVLPANYTHDAADFNRAGLGKKSARWATPVPLLGKDLANAEFKPGAWVWESDALVSKNGGNLWTKESYGDFALTTEFKCDAGSNSGIFIRASDTENWLHNAIEVQILQGPAKDDKHLAGAIFDCLAPKAAIEITPGQWHTMTIIARANRLQVILDQQIIIEMNLELWKQAGKNPDGTPNKFQKAYKDMARAGKIGLQDHGTPIAFRNLIIERL